MNIFIVCTRLCYGGAERVGVMLANGLAQRGHQVTLWADLYDQVTYPIDERVIISNLYTKQYSGLAKWRNSIHNLRNTLKKEKPEVVIGIMWACSLKARIAAIGLNVPVISTVHDAFEHPKSAPMSSFEYFHKFYLNKLYRCVTVLTHADKKIIGKRLKNVYVMPNPLGLAPVVEVPQKGKVILAAGRLDSWYVKGFDLLIEAWGQIAHRHPDWTLKIAGSGTDTSKQFIQRLAKKHQIENQFQLIGFQKNIDEIYKSSAIFVLSSRYEGFGLVLIEAMSQGCACVATDYKGRQKDIITEESEGITCEPEDAALLARGIDQLISDEDYRLSVQRHSIEASKRFSLNKIIDKWEHLLTILSDN